MSGEATTIARPYAEAVFARAEAGDKLEAWSDVLAFLLQVVEEPAIASIIADPMFEREKLTQLVLEIGGDRLDDEGQNLVKLLVQNGRLSVMPEIIAVFEYLKAESRRELKAHVRSAYALDEDEKNKIAAALKAKLGRDITITCEEDAELIGGVHIRAGDMVIDGSVRGRLQQLANELGI